MKDHLMHFITMTLEQFIEYNIQDTALLRQTRQKT